MCAYTRGVEAIVHDPTEGVYATSPDYVHALELRGAERLLFVAGTVGLDRDGQAPETLDEQLRLIWDNLRAILASAVMSVDNVVRITSYLRDAAYAEANAAARNAALGDRRVPTTAVVTGLLSPDWFVEIELVAAG